MKKKYMSVLLSVCLAVMSLTAVIRAEEQVEAVDADAAIVAEEGTVGTEFTEPAERIAAADAEIVEDETLAGFEVIESAESAADEEMPDTLAVEVPGQGEMADEVAEEEPAMDFVETGAEPGFEEDFSVEGTDEGAIEEAVESALEEDATPEETLESESSEEESFAQAEPVMDVVEALPEETDSAENEEEFAGELVFEDIEDDAEEEAEEALETVPEEMTTDKSDDLLPGEEEAAISVDETADPEEQASLRAGECGKEAGTVFWSLSEDGILTISGNGPMADYASGEETPWAVYGESVSALVVEEGVTAIGAYAFAGFNGLVSTEIADSVKVVGSYALSGCGGLTTVSVG